MLYYDTAIMLLIDNQATSTALNMMVRTARLDGKSGKFSRLNGAVLLQALGDTEGSWMPACSNEEPVLEKGALYWYIKQIAGVDL